MKDIAGTRESYMVQPFIESNVEHDAMKQFDKWWQEVQDCAIDEANAFLVSTATLEGKPSARMVFLRHFDANGFVFYTSYTSNKGYELTHNPQVCLHFFWKELKRQVKIEGIAEKLSVEDNDRYFASKSEGRRIAVWASPQSSIVDSKAVIEENIQKYSRKFSGQPVPRPLHWGGYLVKPLLIEFWQGRQNHLHDRLQYTLKKGGGWKIDRLAP